MTDYYSESVFQPEIPKHLITKCDRCIIEAFGVTISESAYDSKNFYLYTNDWCTRGYPLGDDVIEEDLFACLQAIVRRSNGELPWISMETAYYCSKPLPDGFGGRAVFITAHDVRYDSTANWLEERISEVEAEASISKSSQDETLRLCIALEKGMVLDVCSNNPDAFPPCEVIVFEYMSKSDAQDYSADDLLEIRQSDGEIEAAVGYVETIGQSALDLASISKQIKDNNRKEG